MHTLEHERKSILAIASVRGLIGLLVGWLVGVLLVSGIRLALGLPLATPTGFGLTEPTWVVGVLTAAVGFMIASGTVSDWWASARGVRPPEHPQDDFLYGWRRYLSISYDHKVIGIQYGITSLFMFLTAGLFALIFRTELAAPGIQFLPLHDFNTIMSLHGIVMIYGILLGVAAMSNYLVPLMIGANDMLFPRLNAFAFWLNVPAGIILLSSLVLGGFDTGWTGYPPLSRVAPLGMQMFFVGVYLFGFSTILGSLNIIATVIRLRAKGMGYFKMPIFVWTALATAIISLTATQLIALSFQLVMFERLFGMTFFTPDKGGNPILFQHLFWFYSHPAVYVFVLTGLGIISELLPVFARKPLFGYRWVALSSFGIALVGFLVWAHHMFTSGMESYLRVPFMYSTLLVAVPTGVKFFSWIATLWQGKISFETPMLYILGAISIFLLGGLSGPPNGTVSTDLHLQDTYWIVGHFHATMFGGYVFPFFAAIFYWFPKMTGRMYHERMGQLSFAFMLPGFYLQGLAQMLVGLLGMRRRIGDFDPALNIGTAQMLITVAGYMIGVGTLLAIANFIYSAQRGEVAVPNPWRSRSPEFQLPSPLPLVNYPTPIEVVGEPYDYGLAGSAFVNIDKERYQPTPPPAAVGSAAAAPAD
jgi:cytochrome c oxidase subunit 1